MTAQSILTTCPYCGVGCGVDAKVNASKHQVKIKGDKNHPANFGKLCSKGSALAETIELESRLLQPQIYGQNSHWAETLDLVADTFRRTIKEHGPDSVAFYASGQLLTEDYYVANKLMKGFIGSANIDTNSRLCMSSSVAGHKRAFGSDTVPGCYADYELADMIILIGSNTAWCHPVSFQRIRAAKEANPNLKVVVIDPRRTASCDIADLHLAVASGSDGLLFNGLLAYLHRNKAIDANYIATYTEGFDAALHSASRFDLSDIAQQCNLAIEVILQFYQWFAAHEKVMSLYSQGINQSSSGTDKVNSIINCHLASGRIGKPGMGPFSLTGQPNAMGGREVGGLANQLAAHMEFATPNAIERVARFWQSDALATKPGYSAVELFDAIDSGKIKAVWIMATNPVVSLPNADKVKRALQQCAFVVVSDCVAHTDTLDLAHVKLPALGWSEKDGTVTNSERCISRQRPLFAPAGEAKPDWWILTQVARRMGYEQAFHYTSSVEIFREHAALSAFENDAQHGLRDFDISAFADISTQEYEQFQPIQWPVNRKNPNGTPRLFAQGGFFTPSGKAQFIPITPRAPVNKLTTDYPFILNTGRIRDQWHSMTRTALAAKLNQHKSEPCVEIHSLDAQQQHLEDQALAQINSHWGSMLARITVTDTQPQGHLFIPIHWSAQYASLGRVGALVNPEVDPISKQPESKHTPVNIQSYQPTWQGFVLSRRELPQLQTEYLVKVKGEQCYRYELAGNTLIENFSQWVRLQLCVDQSDTPQWQEYQDISKGIYRAARLINEQLESVAFIAPDSHLPERNWLTGLFIKTGLDKDERSALLTGLPPLGTPDVGQIVCSCFNVGAKTILTAIKEKGLTTHQQVGQCLKAGTNCGSCVSEIKALL
ncbi:MAG: molybdopterin-dependent oxidoreductase [Methyloprofundus sp.]|nr:molybdopterin-dependent oxidoreductase [Methyloprofundus sp.]